MWVSRPIVRLDLFLGRGGIPPQTFSHQTACAENPDIAVRGGANHMPQFRKQGPSFRAEPPLDSAGREAFRHCIKRYPLSIESIVVLPDHLHTIWRLPEGNADCSTRWMVIKRRFSSGLRSGQVNASKRSKREKGIWQRRFWQHTIRNQENLQRCLDYGYFNPVKHRYCAAPTDWPLLI